MDSKAFQEWLSAAGVLTGAQRREALAALSCRSEGDASKAAKSQHCRSGGDDAWLFVPLPDVDAG